MNIFVRDRLDNPEGPIAENLAKAGLINLEDEAVYADATCDPDNEPDVVKGENSVIFLHHDNNLTTWVDNFSDFEGHIILISGVGNAAIPDAIVHERMHACAWFPKDFGNPDRPERLGWLIKQLKGDDIRAVDWSLLQLENSEALLAARLLCEAAKICGEKPEHHDHGLTVRRPDDDLLALAIQVIEAKESGPSLDTLVQELYSKLGVEPTS